MTDIDDTIKKMTDAMTADSEQIMATVTILSVGHALRDMLQSVVDKFPVKKHPEQYRLMLYIIHAELSKILTLASEPDAPASEEDYN